MQHSTTPHYVEAAPPNGALIEKASMAKVSSSFPLAVIIASLILFLPGNAHSSQPQALSLWAGEYNSMDSLGPDHGMIQGTVEYVPGKKDTAFYFDGSGFLAIDTIAGFDTSRFSFDLWVRVQPGNRDPAPVFFIGHNRGDTSVVIMPDGSVCLRSEWRHGGCLSQTAADLFKPSELAHMTIVREGGVIRVYKNGTRIGTGANTCCLKLASEIFFGGTDVGTINAGVLLDEIRYYDRALTDEEVFTVYNEYVVNVPDEALLAELDQAYALISDLQQEVDELTQANAALEYQITDLESQNTIYISQILELEAQLNAMEQRVKNLEGQVITLESRVRGLEEQVADLQAQIENLKTHIVNLEGQIRYLEQKVHALQAELDALKQLLTMSLDLLEEDFRSTFKDPGFTIPGNSAEEKLENLVQAIIGLKKGRKRGLYKTLQ